MERRAEQATATRCRILDAASDIYLRSGIESFTLEAVAARAETSVRTVLRAFGSRDRLLFDALDKLARIGVPLKPTEPGDILGAVAAIFDLYENAGEIVLQMLANEARQPDLRKAVDQGREDHRDWVRLAFAPQIEACAPARRGRLFAAIVVATDIYAWSKLRKDLGLNRTDAEAAVRLLVEAATEREGGNGENPMAELVGRRQPSA